MRSFKLSLNFLCESTTILPRILFVDKMDFINQNSATVQPVSGTISEILYAVKQTNFQFWIFRAFLKLTTVTPCNGYRPIVDFRSSNALIDPTIIFFFANTAWPLSNDPEVDSLRTDSLNDLLELIPEFGTQTEQPVSM